MKVSNALWNQTNRINVICTKPKYTSKYANFFMFPHKFFKNGWNEGLHVILSLCFF